MEKFAMRHATQRFQVVLAAVMALAPAVSVFGQSGPSPTRAAATYTAQAPAQALRLSVDDAVKLALEQNLGIQVERINPRIQDIAIAQSRSLWAPTVTSDITNTSRDNAVTNQFAGGQDK